MTEAARIESINSRTEYVIYTAHIAHANTTNWLGSVAVWVLPLQAVCIRTDGHRGIGIRTYSTWAVLEGTRIRMSELSRRSRTPLV